MVDHKDDVASRPIRRSQKTKTKDDNRYLNKRLSWWKKGRLSELLLEGTEIQRRMTVTKLRKKESKLKGFRRLTLDDSENDIAGIYKISEDVKEILKLIYQALMH